MLLLKKAFYLFSWIRYPKITMLKGQGKISRREALIVLPTRLQRANAVIIIKCSRQVYSTHEVTESKCSDIINVTIRYVLPTRLQRENAMIIINVTFRYVLPTRLQRANAVIIIKCNLQVCSTHEVTESMQMQ